MKISAMIFTLFIPLIFSINLVNAQCTPGDEESCPDPEGNGEICPDTLAPVIIGKEYHQEVTMIPPTEIDTLGYTAELYLIKLASIDGLPEGITWETNTEDDKFLAGVYYCILFSGISNDEEGVYPINVVVDIYIKFLNDTLVLPGIVDSTSISMLVKQDANAIDENPALEFVNKIWPNPFQNELNIELAETVNGPVELKIFNLLGQVVFNQVYQPGNTSGILRCEAAYLPEGMYFVTVKSKNKRYSQLVYRSR